MAPAFGQRQNCHILCAQFRPGCYPPIGRGNQLANPKVAIEGPVIKPVVPAEQDAIVETPVHPHDHDLGIPAQDATLTFVSLILF